MDRLEPIWSTLRPSLFLEGGHKEDLLEWLYKNAQKMSEHHLTEHIYWKSVIDLCMDMKGRCDQKSDDTTTLLSLPERSSALSITSSVPSTSVSPNVNSGFFPSPSSGTTSPFPSQRENRSASAYVPMTQVNAEQQTLENSNSETTTTTTTTTYTPIQPTTTTNSISPRTSVVVDSPASSLSSPPKPSETQETSSYATPIEEPKNENLPTSSSEITPKSAPPSRAETPVKENDIFLQESTRPILTRPTSASVTWPPPPPATPASSMQTPVKKWPPPPPSTSSSSTSSSSTSTQTIRPPPPHPSLKSPIKPVPTETPTKQLPPPTTATTPTTTSATPTRVLPPPRRKFEVPKKIETSSSSVASSSSEKTEEIETVVSPGETTPLKPELVKQPSDVKSEETTSTTPSSSSTSAPVVSESPARRPPPPVRTIGGRPAIGRVAFINKSLTFGVGSPPSLGAVVMTGLGSKPAPPRIVSNPSSTTIISTNPSGTKTPPPEEADKSSSTEKKKIYAKALYDNPGENMAESALPFKAGDIVEVLSQDGEWWWGSLKGKMGYVPSNFFNIVDSSLTPPPPVINTSSSPTKTSTIPKPGQLVATTLYDYTPDPPSESSLPIKKGDVVIIDTNILPLDASSEWLYAILDQKGGYIPRNYVQIKT